MSKILAAFPGQGAQYVGMAKELVSEFPIAKLVFEEVEETLKLGMAKLCFEGPKEELVLTANTQPAILTVSVGFFRVLQAECGFTPDLFAGHSLGEYSALVAAGGLTLSRAASLVRQRGMAMQEAVPVGTGGMAACMKLEPRQVEEICREVTIGFSDEKSVQVANYNSPGQIVVAGHIEAVDAFCEAVAKVKGRAIKLEVSAPFHSSLMQPAREAMEPLLRDGGVNEISAQFFPNLTAEAVESYKVEYAIDQIDNPVKWSQTLMAAADLGMTHHVEVGPGKVLSGLAKRGLPKGSDVALLNTEDLIKTIETLKSL